MGHYSRNLLSKYEFYVFNYNLLCLFPILNGKYIVVEIPVTIPAHNAGYYGYVIGKHNHIPEGYTPELWCWWTGSLAASNGMQVSVTSITLNEYGLIIYAPITTAIVNGGIKVLCKKA